VNHKKLFRSGWVIPRRKVADGHLRVLALLIWLMGLLLALLVLLPLALLILLLLALLILALLILLLLALLILLLLALLMLPALLLFLHDKRLLGSLLLLALFVIQSFKTLFKRVIGLPAVGALFWCIDVLETAVLALARSLGMVTTDWHVLVLVIVQIVVVIVAVHVIVVVLCQMGVLPSVLIPRQRARDVRALGEGLDHFHHVQPI
jgi:hypothetical protein